MAGADSIANDRPNRMKPKLNYDDVIVQKDVVHRLHSVVA